MLPKGEAVRALLLALLCVAACSEHDTKRWEAEAHCKRQDRVFRGYGIDGVFERCMRLRHYEP